VWVHVKCTLSISDTQYQRLLDANKAFDFICDSCSISELPFQMWETLDGSIFGNGDGKNGDGGPRGLPQDSRGASASLDDCINPESLQQKGLHFLHANARSLLPKLEDVRLLLNQMGAVVIAISETWLDNIIQDDKVAIDGYRIVRNNRN
jgi:hypothetical protein